MITRSIKIAVLMAVLSMGTTAYGYDFWGVSVSTASHEGINQLAFGSVGAAHLDYTVGGYKYTSVDSEWLGPFTAASPGANYMASRRSDAQALFFRADPDAARFMIITGALQTGAPAPECGLGARLFGPGDLKIDTAGGTYGVGMRLSDLLWAVDPNTANASFKLYKAQGGADDIYARDVGTLGRIELNPQWDHAGNQALAPGADMAYAFYVAGSGANVGSAGVTFANTGLSLYGAGVYAYEVSVPWEVLGMSPRDYSFRASWRPDCGNDVISREFAMDALGVPEPASLPALAIGLAVAAFRRRRR